MTTIDPRIARVRAARQAVLDATAAEERVIRDALSDGALTVMAVARDGLGTRNRQRIYAILGRGADGGEPTAPPLTPVVYLRGAGMPETAWRRVEHAMWARGWATEHDRTTAWHAARGGVPVALCDFSKDLDECPPAPGGGVWRGYNRYVVVGRVRARYQERPDGPDEMDLQCVNGGRHPLPKREDDLLDAQVLARLVAETLT